ncbi:rhodanese-like domain-containing protein [Halomonas sp.]|uniref:rhodanese-like domain-containing protein n=1 Tax=Halomonas sp. TaxID=1486246 RepID=UPI003568F670
MATTIDTTTLRDWQLQQREFTLVDTLPAGSFVEGHLPDAINIVSDDVLAVAPDRLPDKQETIVVYCASTSCKRAGLAADRLAGLGYTQIYHYVGGKKAWVNAGLPLAQ